MDQDRFWRVGAIVVAVVVVVGLAIAIGVSASDDDDKAAATAESAAAEQERAAAEDDLLVIAIALEAEAQDEQLAAEDIARLNEEQRQRAEARKAYLVQLRQVAQAGAAAGKADAEAQASADDQQAAEAARQAREQLKAEINALSDQAAEGSDAEQRQDAVTAYEQLESALASGGAGAEGDSAQQGEQPDSSTQQATAELERLGGEIDRLLQQASAAATAGDVEGVVAALEEIGGLLEQAAG